MQNITALASGILRLAAIFARRAFPLRSILRRGQDRTGTGRLHQNGVGETGVARLGMKPDARYPKDHKLGVDSERSRALTRAPHDSLRGVRGVEWRSAWRRMRWPNRPRPPPSSGAMVCFQGFARRLSAASSCGGRFARQPMLAHQGVEYPVAVTPTALEVRGNRSHV
jgi:hypothetical protein